MHFFDYDTRVAAYAAIVDDDEQLLLTWYNGEGTATASWSMPGGGVEYQESLETAVTREVFEETGFVVCVGAPLVTHSFTKPDGGNRGRPYKSLRVVFDAEITGGSLGTTEVDGSTDFARWVPLHEVTQLVPRADIIDVTLAAFARLKTFNTLDVQHASPLADGTN